jgi:hypothetical protein
MALRALVKADGKKAVDKTSVAQLYRSGGMRQQANRFIAILCAERNRNIVIQLTFDLFFW